MYDTFELRTASQATERQNATAPEKCPGGLCWGPQAGCVGGHGPFPRRGRLIVSYLRRGKLTVSYLAMATRRGEQSARMTRRTIRTGSSQSSCLWGLHVPGCQSQAGRVCGRGGDDGEHAGV